MGPTDIHKIATNRQINYLKNRNMIKDIHLLLYFTGNERENYFIVSLSFEAYCPRCIEFQNMRVAHEKGLRY